MPQESQPPINWTAPISNRLKTGEAQIGGEWVGGEEVEFSPDPGRHSRIAPDTRELLYDLKHPDNSNCWHSGKSLPPFFKYCPYCGTPLRQDGLHGVWLPPFGWSAFSGLDTSQVFHPQPRETEFSWIEPGGDGPLRFWICPQGSDGPSAIYAYRPKQGTIFYCDPSRGTNFVKCQVEGDAGQNLRGEPVGSARSWAPVWIAEHLLFATKTGLLALAFGPEGKVTVQKILDRVCVASPACTSDGLYVPVRAEKSLEIARIDQSLAFLGICEWERGTEPPAEVETVPVSPPSGSMYSDIHWVLTAGVVVVEGKRSRWIAVGAGVMLEPRIPVVEETAGLAVFGWTNDDAHGRLLKRCGLGGSATVNPHEDGEVLSFPSGGAERKQWYGNGRIIKYDSPQFDYSEEDLCKWPLGVWKTSSIFLNSGLPALILGKFDNMPPRRMCNEKAGDEAQLSALELHCAGYSPVSLDFAVGLSMPMDTIIIPVSAESVILYGGDSSPRSWPIYLLAHT